MNKAEKKMIREYVKVLEKRPKITVSEVIEEIKNTFGYTIRLETLQERKEPRELTTKYGIPLFSKDEKIEIGTKDDHF